MMTSPLAGGLEALAAKLAAQAHREYASWGRVRPTLDVPRDWTLVGRGAYGTAYAASTASAARWLAGHRFAGVVGDLARAPPSSQVIVKVQTLPRMPDRRAFVDKYAEALVHRSLPPSPYWVPFYWAGSWGKYFVSAMGKAEGVQLDKYPEPVSQKLHDAIRDAVHALWSAGYAHGDLHVGNMIVAPDESVKIIDFGLALRFATPPSPAHASDAAWRRRFERDPAFSTPGSPRLANTHIVRRAHVATRRGVTFAQTFA